MHDYVLSCQKQYERKIVPYTVFMTNMNRFYMQNEIYSGSIGTAVASYPAHHSVGTRLATRTAA